MCLVRELVSETLLFTNICGYLRDALQVKVHNFENLNTNPLTTTNYLIPLDREIHSDSKVDCIIPV